MLTPPSDQEIVNSDPTDLVVPSLTDQIITDQLELDHFTSAELDECLAEQSVRALPLPRNDDFGMLE